MADHSYQNIVHAFMSNRLKRTLGNLIGAFDSVDTAHLPVDGNSLVRYIPGSLRDPVQIELAVAGIYFHTNPVAINISDGYLTFRERTRELKQPQHVLLRVAHSLSLSGQQLFPGMTLPRVRYFLPGLFWDLKIRNADPLDIPGVGTIMDFATSPENPAIQGYKDWYLVNAGALKTLITAPAQG